MWVHRSHRPKLGAAVILAVVAVTAAHETPPAPPPPAAVHPSPPARIGAGPSEVTTRVDAPAQSTEEEYFQACHAAKTWMQGRPGDPRTRVERYLAAVQVPGVAGPGTWNVEWHQLSPPRQAAVIVAARAAAADECG